MQQGVLPAGAVRGGREAAVVVQGVLGGDSRVWDGKGWGRSGAPGWGSGRSGWGHTVGSPRRPILSPAAAAAKHEAGADLRVAAPMSGDTGAPGSAQPHRGADAEPQRNAAPRPPATGGDPKGRRCGLALEAARMRPELSGTETCGAARGKGGGGLEGGAAKRKTRGSGPQKTPPKKRGEWGGMEPRSAAKRRRGGSSAAHTVRHSGAALRRSGAKPRDNGTPRPNGGGGGTGSGRVKENPEPQNPRGTPNRERHGARRDPDGPITALQPPPPLERWSRRRHRPAALRPHKSVTLQPCRPATLQP